MLTPKIREANMEQKIREKGDSGAKIRDKKIREP